MAFTPDEDDLKYAIDELQDLKFDMEKAIEHVFNNEYILIIGSEVVLKTSVEPSGDVKDYILRHVNKLLNNSKYNSFDEVMLHSGSEIDPIRKLLVWEKFKQSMVVDDVSDELQGLLRTKLLKMVITTTFDSYVEILMRDIWGGRLRVVNVWDEPSLTAFYKDLDNYAEVKSYNEPTLIYAFGKCEERDGLQYARKDFEYIQTIERWMGFGKRDNKMMQFILSKRLLSLGCKFDNWYFRFFWYILRREEVKQRDGDIAISFDKDDRSDQKLENYLKNARAITETKVNARDFMKNLTNVFTSPGPDNPYRELVLKYRRRGQIFFSYCSEDQKLAQQIYQRLRPIYPNLCFDQENILVGANYEKEIKYGIDHAKVFIPLLTPTIAEDLKQGNTDRFYCEEWRMAMSRKGELTIIPIVAEGFSLRGDYYKVFEGIIGKQISAIELSDHNAYRKLRQALDENLKG